MWTGGMRTLPCLSLPCCFPPQHALHKYGATTISNTYTQACKLCLLSSQLTVSLPHMAYCRWHNDGPCGRRMAFSCVAKARPSPNTQQQR